MSNLLTRQSTLLPTIFDDYINPWNNFFGDTRLLNGSMNLPAVNIVTVNGDYQLSMAVPGMKKDDFKIDYDDSLLTISCEKEDSREEKEARYTRKEYSYANFSRTFSLPTEVNTDKIEAQYVDGLLKIKLPIKPELKQVAEHKRITIK